MALKDQDATVFCTPKGVFYYRVMPFGLRNVGATYEKVMQTIFKAMLYVMWMTLWSNLRRD